MKRPAAQQDGRTASQLRQDKLRGILAMANNGCFNRLEKPRFTVFRPCRHTSYGEYRSEWDKRKAY